MTMKGCVVSQRTEVEYEKKEVNHVRTYRHRNTHLRNLRAKRQSCTGVLR